MNRVQRHELAKQVEIAQGLIVRNGKESKQAQYDLDLAQKLLTEVAESLRGQKQE